MAWVSYRAGDVKALAERRLKPGETLTGAALGYEYEPKLSASGWSALGVIVEGVLKGTWPLDRKLGRPYVVARTNRRLFLIACRPSTDARGEPTLAEDEHESFALSRVLPDGVDARSEGDNVTLHFDASAPTGARARFFNKHSARGNLEHAEAVVQPWLR